MKVGDIVPFEFIGEEHEGEVIELYTCTGRNMMLVQSSKDNMKYPIEIKGDIKIDKKKQKAEVVTKPKKKVTKKSRVLDLFNSCKKKDSEEVKIPYKEMEANNFSMKDIPYFKAVLKELKLKAVKTEEYLLIKN